MPKMRAVQVPKPGGPFEVVERDIPDPGPGLVRIKIEACGICHGDSVVKEGHWPGGLQYPRVPGHEVAGVVDAVGPGVVQWKPGDRVGVGWYGGHCGHCQQCRRGDFMNCRTALVCGITFDGGYADYMVAPAEALALIPAELSAADASPLVCAGITTFNALRHSGAKAGKLVAILGIGGLGHLGVQYAAKMGFNTVAIARGQDKAPLALKLGARHYIDTTTQNPAEELQKLGGAKLILATVTNAPAMNAVLGGLGIDGNLLVVGASFEPMAISPLALIPGRRSVAGWASGTAIDSEDTMNFSVLTGVRSINEVFPLERAAEAYDHMMAGRARFRVVLTTGAYT